MYCFETALSSTNANQVQRVRSTRNEICAANCVFSCNCNPFHWPDILLGLSVLRPLQSVMSISYVNSQITQNGLHHVDQLIRSVTGDSQAQQISQNCFIVLSVSNCNRRLIHMWKIWNRIHADCIILFTFYFRDDPSLYFLCHQLNEFVTYCLSLCLRILLCDLLGLAHID